MPKKVWRTWLVNGAAVRLHALIAEGVSKPACDRMSLPLAGVTAKGSIRNCKVCQRLPLPRIRLGVVEKPTPTLVRRCMVRFAPPGQAPVIEAVDGHDALTKLSNSPELMIPDLAMSNMDALAISALNTETDSPLVRVRQPRPRHSGPQQTLQRAPFTFLSIEPGSIRSTHS